MRWYRSWGLLSVLLALALMAVSQFSFGLVAVNAQAGGQEYIVKAGDYLHRIAAEFYGDGSLWPRIVEGTNAKAQEDNRFRTIRDPNLINVGQRLWIPDLEEANDDVEPEATPEEVRVWIASPADGATVPRRFDVSMAAQGVRVERAGEVTPGAGHMHILVDTDYVAPGQVIPRDERYIHYWQGELTGTLELEPGEHVLRLQFSDGAHIALEGDQYRHQISVTVAGAEPDAAGTPAADLPEASSEEAVFFVTPQDGAVVSSPVAIEMGARGVVVEPAGEIRERAGHMHLLIDTDFVPSGEFIVADAQHLHFGRGELTTTLELAPGEHTLRLQFADGAHMAFDSDQLQDEITITVVEPDASGEQVVEVDEPAVFIVSPQDGATVRSPVTVEMAARGVQVEPAGNVRPGAGHMHLLIDTDFAPSGEFIIADEQHLHLGRGELTTTLELEPGEHTLRLQFADGAHIALGGDQYRHQISVTVEE